MFVADVGFNFRPTAENINFALLVCFSRGVCRSIFFSTKIQKVENVVFIFLDVNFPPKVETNMKYSHGIFNRTKV